jgi:hypothetical protein
MQLEVKVKFKPYGRFPRVTSTTEIFAALTQKKNVSSRLVVMATKRVAAIVTTDNDPRGSA